MVLWERAGALDVLDELFRQAAPAGRVALVSGAAGIGKSTLVNAFADRLGPRARVLWGRSDPLITARPSGPLHDIARQAGGPLRPVLHTLAACLTAGLANIAAARGIRLTEVRSTVVGDIDLNGVLGLDPEVRNGYEKVSVHFTVRADAPADVRERLVERSRARSAVFDILTNGGRVCIAVDAAH
jgi:uncharacterized OsmC-like protein